MSLCWHWAYQAAALLSIKCMLEPKLANVLTVQHMFSCEARAYSVITQMRNLVRALLPCSPRLLPSQAKWKRCGWAQQSQNAYSAASVLRLVWMLLVQTVVFSSTVNKTRKRIESEGARFILIMLAWPSHILTALFKSCSFCSSKFLKAITWLQD